MADRMTGQWEVMDIPHRPDDDLVVSITRDLQRKLGPIPPNHKIKMENSFDHERQVHILRARAEPCEPWERENETVVVAGKASGEERMTTRIDGPGLDKMTLKIADATGLLEAMATTPVTDDSHEWIDKDQVWCGLCLMHVHPEHEHRCHSTPSASTK